MIKEYVRHNGHADVSREFVDGSVGLLSEHPREIPLPG
jgi:hypothetical protein